MSLFTSLSANIIYLFISNISSNITNYYQGINLITYHRLPIGHDPTHNIQLLKYCVEYIRSYMRAIASTQCFSLIRIKTTHMLINMNNLLMNISILLLNYCAPYMCNLALSFALPNSTQYPSHKY